MARSTILKVKNVSGSTILGQRAVYISGFDNTDQLPTISLASYESSDTMPCVGLTSGDIIHGEIANIKSIGVVAGYDTSAHDIGSGVYIGSAGQVIFDDPLISHPNYIYQRIGVVAKSARGTSGQLFLSPVEMFNDDAHANSVLNNLDDVNAENPADKYILEFNETLGVWKAVPLRDSGLGIESKGVTLDSWRVRGQLNVDGNIKFPVTAQTSADPNTIDDYREGEFTPTFLDSAGNILSAHTIQVGRYTKIGNLVYFNCQLGIGGTFAPMISTNNILISGLPFLLESTSFSDAAVSVGLGTGLSLPGAAVAVTGHIASGTSTIILSTWSSVLGTQAMTVAQVSISGSLIISGTYRA